MHYRAVTSIPRPSVICGLSLLLVLYSALRGFSPGTPVFPSPQRSAFLNSNSIWIIQCKALLICACKRGYTINKSSSSSSSLLLKSETTPLRWLKLQIALFSFLSRVYLKEVKGSIHKWPPTNLAFELIIQTNFHS